MYQEDRVEDLFVWLTVGSINLLPGKFPGSLVLLMSSKGAFCGAFVLYKVASEIKISEVSAATPQFFRPCPKAPGKRCSKAARPCWEKMPSMPGKWAAKPNSGNAEVRPYLYSVRFNQEVWPLSGQIGA